MWLLYNGTSPNCSSVSLPLLEPIPIHCSHLNQSCQAFPTCTDFSPETISSSPHSIHSRTTLSQKHLQRLKEERKDLWHVLNLVVSKDINRKLHLTNSRLDKHFSMRRRVDEDGPMARALSLDAIHIVSGAKRVTEEAYFKGLVER